VIDTLHTVETPEGVELELPVAGPVVRLLAWLIDAVVQLLTIALLWAILRQNADLDTGLLGLFDIGVFAVLWFYGVVFEVYNHGRTPGKASLGIKVVREDGTPVGFSASILRNFLLFADWLPACYLTGFVSMTVDSSSRRLGDLAAGTLVIYESRGVQPTRASEVAEPRPSPVALEPDERRAVIAFAVRSPLLSDGRAEELASAAVPLLEPAGSSGARRRLVEIAAWLVGAKELGPKEDTK